LIDAVRSATSRYQFHDIQLEIPSSLNASDARLLSEFKCPTSCSLKNDIKAQIMIALRRLNEGPLLRIAIQSAQSYHCELRWPPLYITGRYLKMSRRVSHSRFMPGSPAASVEGLIIAAANDAEIVQCTDIRFQSSGREDIDVRMMGTGRPFCLTLVNPLPRPDRPPPNSIADFAASFADRLPERLDCRCGVSGMELAIAANKPVWDAKKTKCYRCVVYCRVPVTREMLLRLDGIRDLKIRQKTPLRVAHRREMAFREKVIFTLSHRELTDHFFILDLETSGGTYIKEFVHSDFGRTEPSLGGLISPDVPIECQLMQLDVIRVTA
jgi:tRNA pseudouridine synthase 10